MTNARATHSTSAERTDIVVIGSGFGGAITAYHPGGGRGQGGSSGARAVGAE